MDKWIDEKSEFLWIWHIMIAWVLWNITQTSAKMHEKISMAIKLLFQQSKNADQILSVVLDGFHGIHHGRISDNQTKKKEKHSNLID